MAEHGPRMPARPPGLIVFSDLSRAPLAAVLERFTALARAAKAGSVLFTLRDYEVSARARLELGREIRRIARQHGQRFGVADRADLALSLGADALHLPERGLAVEDARSYLGPGAFITQACHDPTRLASEYADALLLSPIAAPRKHNPALGVAAIERARQLLRASKRAPLLFALGGIDAENAASCLAAGADGVAVIGAALAHDPLPLLRSLQLDAA